MIGLGRTIFPKKNSSTQTNPLKFVLNHFQIR